MAEASYHRGRNEEAGTKKHTMTQPDRDRTPARVRTAPGERRADTPSCSRVFCPHSGPKRPRSENKTGPSSGRMRCRGGARKLNSTSDGASFRVRGALSRVETGSRCTGGVSECHKGPPALPSPASPSHPRGSRLTHACQTRSH